MSNFKKIKATIRWITIIPFVIFLDILIYLLGIFFIEYRVFYIDSKSLHWTQKFLEKIGVMQNAKELAKDEVRKVVEDERIK